MPPRYCYCLRGAAAAPLCCIFAGVGRIRAARSAHTAAIATPFALLPGSAVSATRIVLARRLPWHSRHYISSASIPLQHSTMPFHEQARRLHPSPCLHALPARAVLSCPPLPRTHAPSTPTPLSKKGRLWDGQTAYTVNTHMGLVATMPGATTCCRATCHHAHHLSPHLPVQDGPGSIVAYWAFKLLACDALKRTAAIYLAISPTLWIHPFGFHLTRISLWFDHSTEPERGGCLADWRCFRPTRAGCSRQPLTPSSYNASHSPRT